MSDDGPIDFVKAGMDEYQERTDDTAIYPNKDADLTYPTLGLCGESGEVAEKVKKIIRDDGGEVSPEKRALLRKEIGDVLWYAARLCKALGFTLGDAARENLDKLASRKHRGQIKGSGDER